MKLDIILAGVGGQGILTLSYVVDSLAVARGLHFKQAEVHGMAQRGGAVYSHLRISDEEVLSDLVPPGQADLILAVEPLEVQRYLEYLKPTGTVIANTEPHVNISDYPEHDKVLDALRRLPRCVLVDAKDIATRCRAAKAQNMVILGAATAFMPFAIAEYEPFVRKLFGAKGDFLVQANMAVLEAGYAVGAAAREGWAKSA